jgi:flagellar basal-body rod protein FlgB
MIDGIEAITMTSVSLALDAAALRHQTIASNIANANTEGFVPQRVNFDAYVQDARRQLSERGGLDAQSLSTLLNTRPRVEPLTTSAGLPAKVQLDVEVADMAQNAVQYQALIKGLSRQMSILSIAASDGKR